MSKISVIGAGGHSRSSLKLVQSYFSDYEIEVFDNNYNGRRAELIKNCCLVGSEEDISCDSLIFLSIGDNDRRAILFKKYYDRIIKNNLKHSSSIIEDEVNFGISNQIYANTYFNLYVKIGDNNIINTSAILEHEVVIGNHNHISVGAKICGRTQIGNKCFVGAGAILIDRISIGDCVTIGAGAVVINDILESGVYAGVPAKKIK
jgi:UDP-N-acetylbacillosamine N-acetyltransferase